MGSGLAVAERGSRAAAPPDNEDEAGAPAAASRSARAMRAVMDSARFSIAAHLRGRGWRGWRGEKLEPLKVLFMTNTDRQIRHHEKHSKVSQTERHQSLSSQRCEALLPSNPLYHSCSHHSSITAPITATITPASLLHHPPAPTPSPATHHASITPSTV